MLTISAHLLWAQDGDDMNTIPMTTSSEAAFDECMSRADQWYDKKEYFKATESYKECIKIKPSDLANQKIQRSLHSAFEGAFDHHEFDRIYKEGKPYFEYFESDFIPRALYARSSFLVGDYSKAIDNYEWLLQNWASQPVVDYRQVLKDLHYMYQREYLFTKAAGISQRVYRENKEKTAMDRVILDARSQVLLPLLDWSDLLFSDLDEKKIDVLNKLPIPKLINAVSVLAPDQQEIFVYGPQNWLQNVQWEHLNQGADHFRYDQDSSSYLLGKKLSNGGYLLINININLDETEMKIVNDIQGQVYNDNNWDLFFEYEELSGLRYITALTSAFVGIVNDNNEGVSLARYWDSLSDKTSAVYLVYHQASDASEYFNFDIKKADIGMDYWEKSSRTLAFYYEIIDYNKQQVYDITNPVYSYDTKKWLGAIRMGFKKIYD
jgi:hypothetical protein